MDAAGSGVMYNIVKILSICALRRFHLAFNHWSMKIL